MGHIKIVADSSCDIHTMAEVDFAPAALKIITAEREFVDDAALDVGEMIDYLDRYKGRSQTSCPNAGDWLEAFGEADDIICVTLTSALSGSYNAAASAARIYEDEHPGRRVFVLDTLSAGPELRLILEKLSELIGQGLPFETVCAEIQAYRERTGLCFMLKSLKNFANNGRVSPLVARLVGIAGICIVGRASNEGTLEPTDKCRGEGRARATLLERLRESGLSGGRVRIAHCRNEAGARALADLLAEHFPEAEVAVFPCGGLCSFYAETGGMLVGFERGPSLPDA